MLGDRNGGIPDKADIRLLVLIQRRRDTDGDEIYILDKAEIRCCTEFPCLYQLLQVSIHHIADVVFSGVDKIHLFLLYVKANGLKAVFRLVNR